MLVLLLILWTSREVASQNLIKASQSKQGVERERYLRALSIASWRSDAAQRALGDYYSSINQPRWAGEAYRSGSANLDEAAMQAFYRAGEFNQVFRLYQTTSEKARTRQMQYILTASLLSSNKTDEGCKQAQQIGEGGEKLRKACDILSQGSLSRKDSYELIALGIFEPSLKNLSGEPIKTEEDVITLIALYLQSGRGEEAKREAATGAQQFPYSPEVVRLHSSLK